MNSSELIRTLAYLWYTIADKGEVAEAIGVCHKLLDAARSLCEINGMYYKTASDLSQDEQTALLIVRQMEELLEIRSDINQVNC